MSICSHIAKVRFIILPAVVCIMIYSCRESGTATPLIRKANDNIEVKSNCDSSHASQESISPDSLKAPATNSSIKEIKGSKPDISKVKNSQSTTVERPTGSKLPSGTGKPKGSSKPITQQQPSR